MGYPLISIFILGLIHGLTPCEHTWPIIFAYVASERKWIKGLLASIFFVGPALLPWTLIAGFSGFLGSVIWKESYEIYVNLLLGILMIIFGLYTLRFLKVPHLHIKGCCDEKPRRISLRQLPIYGFIFGFAPCAPVLMVYAMAAELHTAFLGLLSGLFFGLGTMISLASIGGILGGGFQFAEEKSRKDLSKICAKISGGILILFGAWLIISTLI